MSQSEVYPNLLDSEEEVEVADFQQVPSQNSSPITHRNIEVSELSEISEEYRISSLPNNCPKHPEEFLQFYCFNNRAIICAECLVKGEYSGTEVANLKRAADRLKPQLQAVLEGSGEKIQDYEQYEREIKYQEAQIQESLETQKADISTKMNLLRQVLDAKERELLAKIDKLEQERLRVFDEKVQELKSVKEKTMNIRNVIETHVQELDAKDFCQFFSEKVDHIARQLKYGLNYEGKVDQKVLERLQLQDQVIAKKLDQAFEKTQALFQGLGEEIGKNMLHLVASTKEQGGSKTGGQRKEVNFAQGKDEEILDDYSFPKRSFSSTKSAQKQLYANPQHCGSFLLAANYGKESEQTLGNSGSRVATEPIVSPGSKKEEGPTLNYYSRSSYKFSHSALKSGSQGGRNEIKSPYKLLDMNKSRSRIFGNNLESSRGLINAVLSPKTERGYSGKMSGLDVSAIEKNNVTATPRDGFEGVEKPKYFSSSAAKAKKGVAFNLEEERGFMKREKGGQTNNKILNDNSLKQKLAQLNLKLFQ